ncbi:type VI secretion system-associated protein TagO [Jannaschia sp. 2305UL9-9]|uniref:type VI secretion system-associated protein TagO n=1 Tax=Jannaschia sp. 2305UL9-9 TaxID=3121638 RepID=UPI003529D2F9
MDGVTLRPRTVAMLAFLSLCLAALVALMPIPAPAASMAGCDRLPIGQRGGCRLLTAQHASDCAGIERATDRLACWDRLHRLANCPAPAGPLDRLRCAVPRRASPTDVEMMSASTPTSRWTLREEDSAFGGPQNVFLSAPSDGPATCGRRVRASLILRCLDDQTAIYVIHECATPRIGSEGWAADIRLDDEAVERLRMTPTHQGDGFGHFTYRDARTLIDRMRNAAHLHLRFQDIEGISTELRFATGGLASDLAKLTRACGWSDVAPWVRKG